MSEDEKRLVSARRFCIASFILGILSCPFVVMFILMVQFAFIIPDWIPGSYFFLSPITAVTALVIGIMGVRRLDFKGHVQEQFGYRMLLTILASVGVVMGVCVVGGLCVMLVVSLVFPRI